jgi:alpha-galactosidase
MFARCLPHIRMGWRSWNCYHGDVSQAKIEATIDAIVEKRAGGTSFLDLGFADVGVDDGWQACGTGRSLDNHSSFHAPDGTPLVNNSKFQDVKAMVAYGHKNKGLTMGWYNNNCMCMDEYTKRNDPVWEEASDRGDVKFLLENDFDAVKIGLYPIVTSQYSSTVLYQFSYHIQQLFFRKRQSDITVGQDR